MSLSGKKAVRQIIDEGDFLEINGQNINFDRINNNFSRNIILADDTTVDGTERTIGEGVPVASNNLTRPASLRTLSVASTSANDTGAGTGMRTLLLIGIDTNGDQQVEIITLTGQTEVDTVNQYTRINEMLGRDTGTGLTNAGIIYCSDNTDTFTAGVPQNRVYDIMDIGHSLSKTGLYTVPNGKEVQMVRINISTDASASNPLKIALYRTSTVVIGFDTEFLIELYYLSLGQTFNLDLTRKIDAGDDIRITAQKTGGGGDIALTLKLQTILKNV